MRAFIAEHGITDLEVSTFASPESRIPHWPGETRAHRSHGVRDAAEATSISWRAFRRVIASASRRGGRKGLVVRREDSSAGDQCARRAAHQLDGSPEVARRGCVARVRACGIRRTARVGCGRAIPGDARRSRGIIPARTEVGDRRVLRIVGKFEGRDGDRRVAFSALRDGASHCRRRGSRCSIWAALAPRKKGFAAFKAGFGTTPIDTQSVSAYVGSPMRRHLSSAIQWLRSTAADRR